MINLFTFVTGEDIALSKADAIVNACNGVGYMGGKSGIIKRRCGVAESIHYISHGTVEKLAKADCRKKEFSAMHREKSLLHPLQT